MSPSIPCAVLFTACVALVTPPALAQNLCPPLEEWRAVDGSGRELGDLPSEGPLFRTADGRIGVRGKGQGAAHWRSPELALEPGGTYSFRFRARRTPALGSGGGLIVSGPDCVNHDFPPPADESEPSFAFRVADGDGRHRLRLGMWELDGEVTFSAPELYPVVATPAVQGKSLTLGEGERVEGTRYVDAHILGWRGTTIHRTLESQKAWFNTNRWCFGQGSEVVYAAAPFAPLSPVRRGRVVLNVNYLTGGALEVSARGDGDEWVAMGEASRTGEASMEIPSRILPAKRIHVRLRGRDGPTNLQVDSYRLEAEGDHPGMTRRGRTWLMEEIVRPPQDRILCMAALPPWLLDHGGADDQDLRITFEVDGLGLAPRILSSPAWQPTRAVYPTPRPLSAGTHVFIVKVDDGNRTILHDRLEVALGPLEERDYGVTLESSAPDIEALWWCEGARKVARDTPPPTPVGEPAGAGPVRIEAARNEHEPAQVVLRAGPHGITLVGATASDLRSGDNRIPASEISILEVATVPLENPIESAGGAGEYPDPLPPLKPPIEIRPLENQALWISVRVPEDAAAGDYEGTIRLETRGGATDVPLRVHVFDFTLPRTTRLRGGFGFDPGLMRRYHGLETDEQTRAVYDLYLRSFAEHRIMPYSFFALDPIKLRWEGEGESKRPLVDFSAFDRAATRCLDGLGFNSFQLPVEGLGGGTFHSRHLGELGGHQAGTPEYEKLMGEYLRQLELHLKERGWLERAYVYWFDEPDPKDYPFVVDVMQRLRRHAPGLRRMLTEQPEPALLGHVEIWCGLTPEWTPERVAARREAGEEVWWYICTGPRAPYIGLFVEHPAIEMRLWGWQTWQYGVEGLLVWQTNYWTSPTAFPDTLQDPWKDPMSYTSGYGVPSGTRLFWGSGDGRFFYPPRRDPNAKGPPVIEPPIASIRLENLRDGIEDFEYLSLLRDLLRREAPGPRPTPRSLLDIPQKISRDLTHFTTDPGLLLEHRHRVAAAIERLERP